MTKRVAYFNGKYVNESNVKISISDRGFVNGDAAFDVARSFNHKPFQVKEHINRWLASLKYLQIDLSLTIEEIENITLEVFRRNEKNMTSQEDCWIRWIATPGENRFHDPMNPTVIIYTPPIPFKSFSQQYIDGAHIIIASTRSVPPQCFDAKAKLYSRVHYALAEIEAHSIDSNAIPVLLDINGYVTECPRQNIFIIKNGKLLTPTRENILLGVTRQTTIELAKQNDIETFEMNLCPYDLFTADEIFITATSFMILPVSKLNSNKVGNVIPGPVTEKLISAWSELVGIDIVKQAIHNAK